MRLQPRRRKGRLLRRRRRVPPSVLCRAPGARAGVPGTPRRPPVTAARGGPGGAPTSPRRPRRSRDGRARRRESARASGCPAPGAGDPARPHVHRPPSRGAGPRGPAPCPRLWHPDGPRGGGLASESASRRPAPPPRPAPEAAAETLPVPAGGAWAGRPPEPWPGEGRRWKPGKPENPRDPQSARKPWVRSRSFGRPQQAPGSAPPPEAARHRSKFASLPLKARRCP